MEHGVVNFCGYLAQNLNDFLSMYAKKLQTYLHYPVIVQT